jgi:hypothetical protein
VRSRPLDAASDLHVAPDHQGSERLRGRFGGRHGRDRLATAQDGNAVRHRLHLVQFVRDEDHRPSLVGHRAQGFEQRLRLLRGQHCGRLVENQDAGLAIERLEDLDALLLSDRELPDPCAGIDREPVALPEFPHAPLDRTRPYAERTSLAAVIAEDDVFGDGERLDQPEVLVHHADSGVDRIARGGESRWLAVEPDLALVGVVEAGEDVRERRLAGAVFAEQSVHLAYGRLEVDAVVRDDAREALDDPAHCHGHP